MTRVHELSDLHLEFHPYTYVCPKGGVDLIVLAGDISSAVGHVPGRTSNNRLLTLLQQCSRHAPVVYVPGNHDFYGSTIVRRMQELRELSHAVPNVYVLYNERVRVAGLDIIGSTMWSDFSLPGFGFGWREAACLNDFRVIGNAAGTGPFTMEECAAEHRRARAFLQSELAGVGADLVVTHFLPCPEAIDERYARSPLNPYFCTDMRHLMSGPEAPHTWVFGHTHHCFRARVLDTELVCNPRGYPGENADFDSKLVIEVPGRGGRGR